MGKIERQEIGTNLTTELDNNVSHIADTTTMHGADAAAAPNKLIIRDANGRAKVIDPSESDDIATKNTVDAVQTNLTNHQNDLTAHGADKQSLFQQALINGNFDIWQRGTSWTNPTSQTRTADKWKTSLFFTSPPSNIIHSQQILSSGELSGSYYFYRIAPDGAGTDVATNFYNIQQWIENGTRFLAGLGNSITISFWARSDITNKRIGVSVWQSYGTGGSPTALETINGTNFTLTSSWQKYVCTISLNTLVGKVFSTNNDDALVLGLWLAWGSNNQATVGANNSETFVGAGNIDIAQVKINFGTISLPFIPKSFTEELQNCQRYYWKSFPYATTPAQNVDYPGAISYTTLIAGVTKHSVRVQFPVRMRNTSGTLTFYNPKALATTWYNKTLAAASGASGTVNSQIEEHGFTATDTGVAGNAVGNEVFIHATYSCDF